MQILGSVLTTIPTKSYEHNELLPLGTVYTVFKHSLSTRMHLFLDLACTTKYGSRLSGLLADLLEFGDACNMVEAAD